MCGWTIIDDLISLALLEVAVSIKVICVDEVNELIQHSLLVAVIISLYISYQDTNVIIILRIN